MNTKHRKTLQAILAKPTSRPIVFSDIEALLVALGGQVMEREGSRVKITLKGEQWRCHRPGKEAKRYQVEEIWEHQLSWRDGGRAPARVRSGD